MRPLARAPELQKRRGTQCHTNGRWPGTGTHAGSYLRASLLIIDVDKVAGSPRDGQLDDLELLLYDLSRPANQAFRRVSGRNSRIDGG
jgi:hypothetical protein